MAGVTPRKFCFVLRLTLLRAVSLCNVWDVQADGPEIRRRREHNGYGLRRFAATAGISHTHLSRVERGKRNPNPEVMAAIARTLGCDIADIETQGDPP